MDMPGRRELIAGSVAFGLGDRTRLVMHEPPCTANASEVVAGRERQRADHFDAEDTPLVAGDDGMGFMTCDRRAARALKNVAPTAHHRDASDNRGPARMNAGDGVIVRPEAGHRLGISHRESGIEGRVGGKDRAFVGHGSPGAIGARRNQAKEFAGAHAHATQTPLPVVEWTSVKIKKALHEPCQESCHDSCKVLPRDGICAMRYQGRPMLETAIIGGGVCGLALAKALHGQGRDFALFEARARLGGRVLSVVCQRRDMAVDLGPTWFWPDTQPLVARLISELGLADFPQHDHGTLLHLRDPDKKPERLDGEGVHNGARRLAGGMASLVDALAAALPQDSVRLGHALTGLTDRGDFIGLVFRCEDRLVEVAARHVVLALPPRLLDEHVRFAPELDGATREAMRATETWMAAQAKVVISYDRALWRDEGQSGNAYVTHEQAVLGEIFDACDMTSSKAALGGFVALSPELRQSFRVGLPMLMANQMSQVFGPALGQDEQHYQDWAVEPDTCSALDRAAPGAAHAGFANPLLRRALWDGKLHLGGSETAAHGSGYLEGAIEAARRISRALLRARASLEQAASWQTESGVRTDSRSLNAVSLVRFREWVATQGNAAFDSYRHRLNRGLVLQQRDQLTQRAALGAIEEVYSKALGFLDELLLDMKDVSVERGRSALMPDVQAPFRDVMQALLDDVTAFNATSCALSNFPDEHHLSKDYLQTILRDIAAAWQEFSLAANALLLSKAVTLGGRQPQDNPTMGALP
jgi:monoamine oxidase